MPAALRPHSECRPLRRCRYELYFLFSLIRVHLCTSVVFVVCSGAATLRTSSARSSGLSMKSVSRDIQLLSMSSVCQRQEFEALHSFRGRHEDRSPAAVRRPCIARASSRPAKSCSGNISHPQGRPGPAGGLHILSGRRQCADLTVTSCPSRDSTAASAQGVAPRRRPLSAGVLRGYG